MTDDVEWDEFHTRALSVTRIFEEMGIEDERYESVQEMVREVLYAADFGFERCEIEKRQVWHVSAKFHQLPEYWVRPIVDNDRKFTLFLCGVDDVALIGDHGTEWHFPEATARKLLDAVESAYRDPW